MPQLGWHISIENCIACRACETACKQEFRLPVGVRRRLVVVQDGTAASGRPYRMHTTMACMHCARPGCVTACPVGRYWKDDESNAALRTAFGLADRPTTGLVLIKPTRAQDPVNGVDCLGCKRCIAACPYGAPRFDHKSRVTDKCTGCYHRLHNSSLPEERRKPACVLTCTALALHFDEMSAITGGTYGPANATTGAPAGALEVADPSLTGPSVRFAPQTNLT